ncbi:site-2 protease family protein [Botrimarina sp.]|uniref:site-2 protease family protein n=1 Tax=Botrimarina sp. TaxID=2795802 RepID=UPI0032EE8950
MGGSARVGKLAGIDLFIHWTFPLLLAWIAISHVMQGDSVGVAVEGVVFVCLLFACVVLHELGHALAARRYGVPTRDITLLPIGGVARLERIPEEPRQELVIAIAGPLVNVVIAAGLFAFLFLASGYTGALPEELVGVGGNLLVKLMWVNVALVVFNMLPAFPMDGGRVLRALLATRMSYSRATEIAARVGQTMAVGFALLGLFGNPLLLFIAIFVYLGAGAEAQAAATKSLLRGYTAGDAMMTRFRTFPSDASLKQLTDELLAGTQDAFPLVDDGAYRALVTRASLLAAIAEVGPDARADTAIDSSTIRAGRGTSLDKLADSLSESTSNTAVVLDGEQLIGLVSTENVGEMLLVRAATSPQRGDSEAAQRVGDRFVKTAAAS